MSQQTALEKILEAVSDDESLRDALLAHLLPNPNQNSGGESQHVTNGDPPNAHPELATQTYQSGNNNPALAAQTHQSGIINNSTPELVNSHWRTKILRVIQVDYWRHSSVVSN